MNKKGKVLLLAICVLVFGCILSGCGMAAKTSVKVTSATKGSYTIKAGYDDEFMTTLAEMSGTTKKALISEMTKEGAKYTKEKIDGITYHMFSASAKNVKLSTIEELLAEEGFTNVCLTKNYLYAVFNPEALSNSVSKATTSAALTSTTGNQALDDMSFYMSVKITMKSKIKTTNGKLSQKSKTATWVIKDASKKKTIYASTTKTSKTAKAASVKKGKTYKAGKKLTVSNSSSLVKMKLDGKTVKAGSKVTKKGKHTLKIWSKNGKLQTVTFRIK